MPTVPTADIVSNERGSLKSVELHILTEPLCLDSTVLAARCRAEGHDLTVWSIRVDGRRQWRHFCSSCSRTFSLGMVA